MPPPSPWLAEELEGLLRDPRDFSRVVTVLGNRRLPELMLKLGLATPKCDGNHHSGSNLSGFCWLVTAGNLDFLCFLGIGVWFTICSINVNILARDLYATKIRWWKEIKAVNYDQSTGHQSTPANWWSLCNYCALLSINLHCQVSFTGMGKSTFESPAVTTKYRHLL